jgi:hypothetical protein
MGSFSLKPIFSTFLGRLQLTVCALALFGIIEIKFVGKTNGI